MKKKLQCTLAIASILASFGAVSTVAHAASNSSSYEFTMNHRIVDGKANNSYHTLSAGAVYINGVHYEYDAGVNPVGPNDIHYALLRDRVGPDVNCGSITCSNYIYPSGRLGTADKASSKYYLQIFKVEDDGRDVRGSGTIYNKE